MAAPSINERKRPARRAANAARQTIIERVRQSIPGNGVFLVASIENYPHRSYPAPTADLPDLDLRPGIGVTIDEQWLASPLLIRDYQGGIVKLELLDELPRPADLDPDPETVAGLPPQMRQMVRTICEMPLSRQHTDILSLSEQIKRTGLPAKDSRVTKAYLRGEYAVFLRAVQALEAKRSARPEVLELVAAQLARIESF